MTLKPFPHLSDAEPFPSPPLCPCPPPPPCQCPLKGDIVHCPLCWAGREQPCPCPALCQPPAAATARMGCCLGTPWHQDLALGCTGKVPVGFCCVTESSCRGMGTPGDTLTPLDISGMLLMLSPLGLGSEAAHFGQGRGRMAQGLVYSHAVGFSPLHPACPGTAHGVLASPKAPFPFQCVPVSWRSGSGPATVATCPQQGQGQEVPRAPSPGARSAALSAGTCSWLGAGAVSCPLLQNILAWRRSVSHWHG